MPRYSAAQKAIACEIVARFEGEISQDAMETIRDALDAPTLNTSTVYRWTQMQPIANELQSVKKTAADKAALALDDYFERVARQLLDHASRPDVVEAMKGREAILSAAIAVDKMQLLRKLPTEIIQLLPGLQEALATLGMNPADMINAIIAEAAARRAYDDLNAD